ncbi:integrase [compost metagenome]
MGGVDGLCLNVEGSSRVWILRAIVGKRLDKDGKLKPHRRDIGIGPYPEVSLAEARAKATELRLQIRNGIDPIAYKQEKFQALRVQKLRERAFSECAQIVITNKSRELKNQKHIAQWSTTLETYIYPTLGDRIISSITKVDIAKVLEPIWSEKMKLLNDFVVVLKPFLIMQRLWNILWVITLLNGKVTYNLS